MPKYWGKQIFSLGISPEVGQKQKTEREKQKRAKVGNNNGQLRIANATSCGARKATWATKKKFGLFSSFYGQLSIAEA